MHDLTPPGSLTDLFRGFVSIGSRSFGGVMPWAYRVMVEERRWLSGSDFTETVGLCQFLPGPNIGNMSVVLGKRWFGWRGALVGFAGLIAVPFVWVLTLAALYGDVASLPHVRAMVTGVGAAAAGLFMATAMKLGRPIARKPVAWCVAIACFLAAAVAWYPLPLVVPAVALVAIPLARADRL